MKKRVSLLTWIRGLEKPLSENHAYHMAREGKRFKTCRKESGRWTIEAGEVDPRYPKAGRPKGVK